MLYLIPYSFKDPSGIERVSYRKAHIIVLLMQNRVMV